MPLKANGERHRVLGISLVFSTLMDRLSSSTKGDDSPKLGEDEEGIANGSC